MSSLSLWTYEFNSLRHVQQSHPLLAGARASHMQTLSPETSSPDLFPPGEVPSGIPGYRSLPGSYDEMVDASGTLRPHWRQFGTLLADHTPESMKDRQEMIQRLLRDHGVTYNFYEDRKDSVRTWALDMLPVIIASSEWRGVSAGLEQRARLLNLILADIYGAQRMLKEGVLPPRLLYANPSFLRPIQGVSPYKGQFLATMGTDLIRGANGRWMALSDRVQAPSGMGYTLENRIILSRAFPDEFNRVGVERLTNFYDTERELFRSLAPQRRGSATVVMMSPGPFNETYFEHAFKARYSGFPLVEGADLTVRDQRVHLKTLEGLRRVDVIVRRVDELFCDPLELKTDTLLGVPGLVEAWRSGNVSIVNGLGTGVVETPALHPFLPGLCRALLGQELILPGAPTWWCGQQRELAMVLAEPDRWIVKPTFASGARDPIYLGELDSKKRAEVLDRVKAAPSEWVAQEVFALSTAPTWIDGKVQPRSLVWRAFTVSAGDKYTVMPGGLSRVSPEPQRFVFTIRSGGISKDTWVLADGPVDGQTISSGVVQQIRPGRSPSGVPSRVGDHLFWLGRYMERLEQTVRTLRVVLLRLIGEGSEQQKRERAGGLQLLHGLHLVPSTLLQKTDTASILADLHQLITQVSREGGLPGSISRVRYNASAARDRLSDDMWRLLNRIDVGGPQLKNGPSFVSEALAVLDGIILSSAAFSGMMMENMTRGHGWRFLEIGRRLERALVICTLVEAAVPFAIKDDSILPPMLEVGDITMTYRRFHVAQPSLLPVLDLLLLNEANPRSVSFQLSVLSRTAAQLPHSTYATIDAKTKFIADSLQSELASLNLTVAAQAKEAVASSVPILCKRLCSGLEELSDEITNYYFSHAMRGERVGE